MLQGMACSGDPLSWCDRTSDQPRWSTQPNRNARTQPPSQVERQLPDLLAGCPVASAHRQREDECGKQARQLELGRPKADDGEHERHRAAECQQRRRLRSMSISGQLALAAAQDAVDISGQSLCVGASVTSLHWQWDSSNCCAAAVRQQQSSSSRAAAAEAAPPAFGTDLLQSPLTHA